MPGLITTFSTLMLSTRVKARLVTLAQEVSPIFGLYPSSLARSSGFFSLTEKASLVSISGTFLFLWDRVFIYRWSSNFLKKVALKGSDGD